MSDTMQEWFTYALGLSEAFMEMKFELYGSAVAALVAATEDLELQLRQKGGNTDAAQGTGSLFQAVLMSKPPSGGSKKKTLEECVDVIEYEKDRTYATINEDGFVMTSEDEAVLQREVERQELWFTHDTKEQEIQATGTAAAPGDSGSGSMGLYGELTSVGVRQMHHLHWCTVESYEAHCSSSSSSSSSSFLQVDVGSGTGKVIYEWALLVDQERRSNKRKIGACVSLGVEIMPSRMSIARRALLSMGKTQAARHGPPPELFELKEVAGETPLNGPRGGLKLVPLGEEEIGEQSSIYRVCSTPAPRSVGDLLLPGAEKNAVVLTEANGLLPSLLSNAQLLYPLSSVSPGTSLSERHLAVLCCGVGFDEVFVRRLCRQLEAMLFGTRSGGREHACPDACTPLWNCASFLLLLRHLDVEGVLQSSNFPLFRCVQQWRRGRKGRSVPPRLAGGAYAQEKRETTDEDDGESTEVFHEVPASQLPSWCGRKEGAGAGKPGQLLSSRITYTHVQTTWMSETPAWHLQFFFAPSS